MRRSFVTLVSAAALMCTAHAAWAGSVNVSDGTLSDWGIDIKTGSQGSYRMVDGTKVYFNATGTGTNYNAGPRPTGFKTEDGAEGVNNYGIPNPVNGNPWSEDTWDGTNSGLVDPNWGGQNYDVEWMGAAIDQDMLYLGMLSGLRLDNGFGNFGPGDIRLVLTDKDGNKTEYGIEVGGGVGSDSLWSTPIAKGGAGSTYILNSGGGTDKVMTSWDGSNNASTGDTTQRLYTPSTLGNPSVYSDTKCGKTNNAGQGSYGINEDQEAGTIWRMSDDDWIRDPIYQSAGSNPDGNDKAQIGCGAEKADNSAVVAYQYSAYNGYNNKTHAVIEVQLNLAKLGSFTSLDIYWGPACGNDGGHLHHEEPGAQVPAPAGLWLLGSAALVLAVRRRRACRI